MAVSNRSASLFAVPHAMTFVLAAINIAMFALCLSQSNGPDISPSMQLRYGALYPGALADHDYWRFLAHGFLHANPLHLASNMLCLMLWGAHLERWVGAFYFLVIYLCSLVAGGLTSVVAHAGGILLVGASGATSGILGVLLALVILGRAAIPANFFVANIGLNVGLAFAVTRIDWTAHLGGFIGGMIACALLDIIEKLNRYLFRNKFPEFVKVNGGALAGLLAAYAWASGWLPESWSVQARAIVVVATCLVFAKLADLILSAKKGLAVIVIVLAMLNAACVFIFGGVLASACMANGIARMIGAIADFLCANNGLVAAIFPFAALVATLIVLGKELIRGINDVGFVSATLSAERRRRDGL